MRYILALVGAVFGFVLTEIPPLLGLVLGFLTGVAMESGRRIKRLEARVSALEPDAALYNGERAEEPPYEAEIDVEPEIGPAVKPVEPSGLEPDVAEEPPATASDGAPEPSPKLITEPSPDVWQRVADRIKDFLTTGNPVVRLGLIILFFGVAFLAKYAAANDYLPVWLRLTGVAAGGAVLLGFGWRLRKRRTGYALLLQGGGVGILYLTLFAAARFYDLVPMAFAFGLMVALVGFSGLLAVLQDSMSLAAFGAAGGFLAPVLVSTGSGSLMALFSYYALLNTGVFGVSLFKAWRPLNLLGAVFTFGIGSLWGAKYYQPEYFSTVEPFLILFFLFYVAIAVLFAWKQPVCLKGYVDGTLVFGVPIAVFALQGAMVRTYEFGMAFSALGMSGVYIGLATALWRKDGMRLLTQAFLALGVVFGSLAIPLGLEGNWTAAAWALEGAGLVWIGVRQERLLARLFGLLLVIGAGIAVFVGGETSQGRIPLVNAAFIGCLMVSFAGFFSGWQIHLSRDRLWSWERWFSIPLMCWGLIWWTGSGLLEIAIHLDMDDWFNGMLVFLAATAAILEWASRPLDWPVLRHPPLVWLPALMLLTIAGFSDTPDAHPFGGWNWLAWGVALLVQYFLLWRMDDCGVPEERLSGVIPPAQHLLSLLLLVFWLSWEASWLAGRVSEAGAWQAMAWGFVPALAALALMAWGRRVVWPVMRREDLYLGAAPMTLLGLSLFWEIAVSMLPGDPAPLPYLPLLNPLDAAQAFVFLITIRWIWETHQRRLPLIPGIETYHAVWLVSGGIFFWLTAVVARAIHFWGRIPFDLDALWNATLFQSAASILWSVIALGVMVWAAKHGARRAWIAGGGILGVVAVKLFLVDLAGTGTVSRIVSFLVVGALMLVIGYLSPLPPHADGGEK